MGTSARRLGTSACNGLVIALLGTPVHVLLDRSLIGLRLRGRVSGRLIELPVSFAASADAAVVVPGSAERKRWWRNLRLPTPVEVLHGGEWFPSVGRVLQPGDRGFADALSLYVERWPRVRTSDVSCLVVIQPWRESLQRSRETSVAEADVGLG
jgi:hypothetical protein